LPRGESTADKAATGRREADGSPREGSGHKR
jgi:hypothetical protein